MTTTTIPEIIVPSELTSYTGRDFMTVASGTLPNGDDSLLNTSAADSDVEQQAFQERRLDSHMLRLFPNTNGLSFWIRRRQNFNAFQALSTATSGTFTDPDGILMGVGDPTAIDLDWSFRRLAWCVAAASASRIQFSILGWVNNQYGAYALPEFELTLDTWHLVVVNGLYEGNSGENGSLTGYLDGRLIGTNNVIASSSYYIAPQTVNNYDFARFALGDPTMAGRSIQGAADGPLYDIAKLVFHDREVTPLEQLTMLESMRYGP